MTPRKKKYSVTRPTTEMQEAMNECCAFVHERYPGSVFAVLVSPQPDTGEREPTVEDTILLVGSSTGTHNTKSLIRLAAAMVQQDEARLGDVAAADSKMTKRNLN